MTQQQFDVCIIGNGVSALWAAQWFSRRGKTVAWLTRDTAWDFERACLQHAWLGGVSDESAAWLKEEMAFSPSSLFDIAYYDAKSSKRLRRVSEVKIEWGEHEEEFFKAYPYANTNDLLGFSTNLNGVEPFLTATNPLIELGIEEGRVCSALVANGKETLEIRAAKFVFGDVEENLSGFIRDEKAAKSLTATQRGREFLTGFGLHFWHKEFASSVQQAVVLPLVVNPSKKEDQSHLAGRIVEGQSYWVGFVNAEELEDNNEILRKIKSARRAIDRALPGFSDSITREAVSFEIKMFASDLKKSRSWNALGAHLISDQFGADTAVMALKTMIQEIHTAEPEYAAQHSHPAAYVEPAAFDPVFS